MIDPEANAAPVDLGDGRTLEKRVCSCCKEPRPRYFVRRDGKIVRMAHTHEGAVGTPDPSPEERPPEEEPDHRAIPSSQQELLSGETKFGI